MAYTLSKLVLQQKPPSLAKHLSQGLSSKSLPLQTAVGTVSETGIAASKKNSCLEIK